VLRYYVAKAPLRALTLIEPVEGTLFRWEETGGAAVYLLEIVDAASQQVLSAVVRAGTPSYRAPSWLREKANAVDLRWRVGAIDQSGRKIAESGWRRL
jgi:hypothetical protein